MKSAFFQPIAEAADLLDALAADGLIGPAQSADAARLAAALRRATTCELAAQLEEATTSWNNLAAQLHEARSHAAFLKIRLAAAKRYLRTVVFMGRN